MGRIFYICPDFAPPSAGTRRLYRHVEHLVKRGFQAFIVHNKRGFSLTWHSHRVPIVWMEGKLEVSKEDILVIPEGMTRIIENTTHLPCKRIGICLNWAYVYRNLPMGKDWKDFGIEDAITPSGVIKRFLEWSMGLQVGLVGNYVNTQKFRYNPDEKKSQIVYNARKDLSGEVLRSVFTKRDGVFRNYTWVRLEDLTEDEYASVLNKSSIFLATSSEEGVPTSALEAMAAGCVVIGFAGVGGTDEMIGAGKDQNCLLVENGDIHSLGQELERVMECEDTRKVYRAIINNGIKTAARLGDYEKEGESITSYFQVLCRTDG